MLRVVLILSCLVTLSACERSKLDEAEWKEAGAEAVLPFKKNLKSALLAGLEAGPEEAIAACRMEAPRLAKAASSDEVTVGRASLKLRNPDNVAKPWMVPLLQGYEADPNAREPKVVAIDANTVGYVEPIYLKPLCVTCHGAELEPDLQTRISELYPNDRAIGYAAGDLRGVFWAELRRD